MRLPELTEDLIRFLAASFAQFILGLLMFLIFRYFSKIYVRKFLRLWSRSWIAFAGYKFCLALSTIAPDNSALNIIISFFAQLGCYLQIAMILLGAGQLVFERPIKRKHINLILAFSSALAFVTALAFTISPDHDILRIGSRSIISGCGFIIAGSVVWRHQKFTRGLGQKLLVFSFFSLSLVEFYFLAIALANLLGSPLSIPNFFSSIYMLTLAMTAVGMVMWLLENEREKLDKANKELDSFLYSTSHDLRAPISSILGLTYIGKLELQEEKARTFMGMIEDRIRKLDLIITDVLSLARSKKFDVKIEGIDFNVLLEETIVDVKFNKGASSITLRYEPDSKNVFQSDYHQVKIILNNLISNAVKYHNLNQPNPYIKVTFNKSKEKIFIDVEDNGQGIDQESLPKIFEMFYRASNQTDGTGLGLYIVKEALTKIKGTIDVSSELGRGSKFSVKLENSSGEMMDI